MNIIFFPWENGGEPDFINEEGFEWWLDGETNKYIKSAQLSLPALTGMLCFFVRKDGVPLTRVLIDTDQKVLKDSTNWEDMLCFINIIKVKKSFDEK